MPAQLSRVTERIWCIRRASYLTCSYAVRTDDGIVLVEANPRAVAADTFVDDDMVVERDFVVIATPGHTPGHVAYFYRPEKVLFAGNALAVKRHRLALMSRPVTPDLPAARTSLVHCLDRSLALGVERVCPGHQYPLSHGVRGSAERLRDHVACGGRWPMFG